MAKNASNDKKTLKDELLAFESDLWCADRFILYGDYLGESVLPDGNILDDYYDYFQQFLEETDISDEYFYKPAAFSEDFYGTPDLDFLVMYFAQIPTILEFNQKTIKTLPSKYLTEINNIAVTYKKKVDTSYETPTVYAPIAGISEYKKNYL